MLVENICSILIYGDVMKALFKNAKIVLPDKVIAGDVLVENGKIIKIGEVKDSAEKVADLCGNYLCPGFVDIHNHGGAGYEFIDATEEAYLGALRAHLKGGTTTIVPTFSSYPLDMLLSAISVFNDLKEREAQIDGIPHLAGLHMEGPNFAAAQAGAQDPDVIHPPKKEEYEAILAATPYVKRWSVAPELSGALEFGRYLSERGINASIGHSDANTDTTLEAVKYGYDTVTHVYSGCSLVHRNGAFREGGVVEGAFLADGLTVEIIADGAHLPKELLQLIYKIKGPDKIAMVTDCIRPGGESFPDGTVLPYDKVKGIDITIERGVALLPGGKAFAGSLATTSHLVRIMVNLAGIPIYEVCRMMSLNPARIIKMDDEIGSIEVGKCADFTVLDNNLEVASVILKGETAYER